MGDRNWLRTLQSGIEADLMVDLYTMGKHTLSKKSNNFYNKTGFGSELIIILTTLSIEGIPEQNRAIIRGLRCG